MRFVLSGGGTAGHINPALALAEELVSRGHEVSFAGTPAGMESRLVPAAGFDFRPFEAAGFNRSHPLTLLRSLRLIGKSRRRAREWFSEKRPDAVIGFGGYVCIPVCSAAEEMGIPVILHEQNSVMGIANKELARKAAKVALTYEVAGNAVADKSKLVLTGNPVRRSVLAATREEGRAYLGIPDDALLLLVFGGSQGARHLNSAICALKDRLLAKPNLYVVQIAGPKEYDTVAAELALDDEQSKRWILKDYENQMGAVMAATDIVVSRAGASSLAEISARRIPGLLVPFPYATADHQTVNARSYVEAGAALMGADDAVEMPDFAEKLLSLVDDDAARQAMRDAAAEFDTAGAAGKLADVVIAAAKRA